MTDARDALLVSLFSHGPLTADQAAGAYRRLCPNSRMQIKQCDEMVEAGWLTRFDRAPGISPTFVATPKGLADLGEFMREYAPLFKSGAEWLEDTSKSVFDAIVRPAGS